MISYEEAKKIALKEYPDVDCCERIVSYGYRFFNAKAEQKFIEENLFDDAYGTGIIVGNDGLIKYDFRLYFTGIDCLKFVPVDFETGEDTDFEYDDDDE